MNKTAFNFYAVDDDCYLLKGFDDEDDCLDYCIKNNVLMETKEDLTTKEIDSSIESFWKTKETNNES